MDVRLGEVRFDLTHSSFSSDPFYLDFCTLLRRLSILLLPLDVEAETELWMKYDCSDHLCNFS